MKVFNISKFGEAAAIGTDENERVRNKSDAARLVQNESAWIDRGLVLVIEKCIVYALLGKHGWALPAVHGTQEPTLDKLCEVVEKLLMDRRGRRGEGCWKWNGNATAQPALVCEQCTRGV